MDRNKANFRRANNQPSYRRMPREEYLIRAHEFAKRGEQLKTKLTNSDVEQIRINRHGLTYKQLAEKYGVHVNTIYKASKGITWNMPSL